MIMAMAKGLRLRSSRSIVGSISITTPLHTSHHRTLFNSTPKPSTNRIYDSIRDPSSLETLLLLSSSSRTPLITLFKTSLCRSCAAVSPLIRQVLASHDESGFNGRHVGFAEVELDAPDARELGMRYGIRSIPTLLAFDRREAQMETMVTDVESLKSEKFLREWIETEASRAGEGGAGGSLLGGLFKTGG